jgi:opacity protein-like surface antigen
MIKKNLLIIQFLFLGTVLNAQNIALGIKVGGNLSSFYGKDMPVSYKFKPGFAFGFISSFKAGNHFYLQPELNYEQKGGKHHLTGANAGLTWDSESTFKSNYLTMPILVKLSLGQKESFFLLFGPHIGFLLKATERYVVTDPSTGDVVSDDGSDITKNCNKTDFGFTAGGGTTFKLSGNLKLFVDARYFMSFNSVNREEVAVWSPKNYGFNLNTGLLINLK